MKRITADCLLEAQATLGEGACWDSRKQLLYWVDILENEVHILDPTTGRDVFWKTPYHVSFVHPTIKGDLILGTAHGLARLDPKDGAFTPLVDPEADQPGNRFNDGKPDPVGRLYAGSIAYDGQPGKANFWRFQPDLSYTKLLDHVGNSNGLCWSPDEKTLYYIDTKLRRVDAFDYHVSTGEITNRRTVVMVPPDMGAPDGMTIDDEGCLWTALWGGHGVARWNPKTGELLAKISAPCAHVTCPTFGGKDLDILYFTTAQKGRAQAEPDHSFGAGHLYAAAPGSRGLPGFLFTG